MSDSFVIVALLTGDGLEVGFTDAGHVSLPRSNSDPRLLGFQEGITSVSVPANVLSIDGSGVSGSANLSVSADSFDLLGAVASGVVSTGVNIEIRQLTDEEYFDHAVMLFKGTLSSAKIDEYTGSVDLSFDSSPQVVNVDFPSARIGDAGRFDRPPEGSFDRVLPVVYGLVRRYSIPAIAFSTTASGGGTVDLCIAGHSVYGDINKPGFVRIGNSALGDMSPYYKILESADNYGDSYSFIRIPFNLYDDGIYARDLSGKVNSDGSRMESLGDIITNIWFSYTNNSSKNFDSSRSSYASDRLNKFQCGFAFTEADDGQTLFDVLVGRIGNLPVSFGSPRGLFGWDSKVVPTEHSEVFGLLEFGVNIFERSEINLVGYDKVQNRFRVSFDYDSESEGNTQSLLIDENTSSLCRESQARYGKSQYIKLGVPDVVTPWSAGAYLSNEVNRRAFPRIQISYFSDDISFLSTPMLSVFKVTDTEIGLSDSLFFLESAAPDLQSGGCLITLKSVLSSESTFIRSNL